MATDFKPNSLVGLGAIEATKGTYVEPTTAGVELYDVTPIKVDTSPTRVGNLSNGTFKKGKYYSGTRKGSTSFTAELKSSGDPTVAPALGDYLRMGGFREQTVDTDKVGYIFDGIPGCETMSFKYQMYNCGTLPEGFKQGLRGAKANITIAAAGVGAPVTVAFEVSGAATPEADVAAGAPLVAVPVDTTDCEKFMGVMTSVGGQMVSMTSFELTIQGVVNPREDSNNADGLAYFDLTDADVNLTANWVVEDVAAKDYYGDMIDDVVYSELLLQFKAWDLKLTGAQIYDMTLEDVNGFAGRNSSIAIEQVELNQKTVA